MAEACGRCIQTPISSLVVVPEPSSIVLLVVSTVCVLILLRLFWWKRPERPHIVTKKTWSDFAWKCICLWAMANLCLLVALCIRARVLLPDTSAAEYSVLLLLWNMLPLCGMLCFLCPIRGKSLANPAIYMVVIGVSAYGTHGFLNAYYFYPEDGQGCLGVMVAPFVQWLVFLLAFLLLGVGRQATGLKMKPSRNSDPDEGCGEEERGRLPPSNSGLGQGRHY